VIIPLLNETKAIGDIISAVGDEKMVSEGSEKVVESRRGVDIRIIVTEPSFRVFVKKSAGDASLLVLRKSGKVNVFLHTIGPIRDVAKGHIGAIEYSGFGDFETGYHWGGGGAGWAGWAGWAWLNWLG
jgi:hypothetical protein